VWVVAIVHIAPTQELKSIVVLLGSSQLANKIGKAEAQNQYRHIQQVVSTIQQTGSCLDPKPPKGMSHDMCSSSS
jgi:hypothetical protein